MGTCNFFFCSGDQISIDGLQHPFDIMTKTKMDLERYVMFVQVLHLCAREGGMGEKEG